MKEETMTAKLVRQIAADLLDRAPFTVEDYGSAEAFARDLLMEVRDELRKLSDDDWGFLVFTLVEMAGQNTNPEERSK
jgi:hypothetical protein